MHRVAYPLRFLERVGASLRFPSSSTQRLGSRASGPSFLDRLTKIFFFVASVRDLFVRQLYRAERIFRPLKIAEVFVKKKPAKKSTTKKGK
jgi:hypothetical protein